MPAKNSGKLKDTFLVVCFILMVGSCLMALSSNQTAGRVQQDLEQERYQRIVAEENLYQATMKLTNVESELSQAQSRIESIQVILKEGSDQSSNLKEQLDSLARTKEELEKKIEVLKLEQSLMVTEMQAAAAAAQVPPPPVEVPEIVPPAEILNQEIVPPPAP